MSKLHDPKPSMQFNSYISFFFLVNLDLSEQSTLFIVKSQWNCYVDFIEELESF